jgi:hypothetical protein
MSMRTSQSHPLEIATLPAGAGRLGLTFCPGKYQPGAFSGSWDRCLQTDLDAVVAWGAACVVTLNEAHELEALRVPQLGAEVARRGMRWLHLPIVDQRAPDAAFEAAWPEASRELHAMLAECRGIVIHCKGGLGRTGTIAARLLVELGMEAEAAILTVRAARPDTIENAEQEEHVRERGRVCEDTWFSRITGFTEGDYASTQSRLRVDGDLLVCRATGRRHHMGRLSLPTLAALRAEGTLLPKSGRSTLTAIAGEARALHRDPAAAGAVFQLASQFNLLEMVGPDVTPEHGVTGYEQDNTQGPACAIAAGAATILRNYLVPMPHGSGQRHNAQLDALAGFGEALAESMGVSPGELWRMQNGYAMLEAQGLVAIAEHMKQMEEAALDRLRSELCIGLHEDVDVTELPHCHRHRVDHALCFALPVGYHHGLGIADATWQPLAQLVLEAAYEATLLAAAKRRGEGRSGLVFLTRLGGGAFGNQAEWIDAAIRRAMHCVEHAGLEVRLVGYGQVHPRDAALAAGWQRAAQAGC